VPWRLSCTVRTCGATAGRPRSRPTSDSWKSRRTWRASPNTLEKYVVARRVEALGAGLAVTSQATRLTGAKLTALLDQRSYRRAAALFREKYANWSAMTQSEAMRQALESL
jgi:hypothetical protein